MSLRVLSTSLMYSNRNSQRLSFQPWGSDVKVVETDVQEQDRATSRAATEHSNSQKNQRSLELSCGLRESELEM